MFYCGGFFGILFTMFICILLTTIIHIADCVCFFFCNRFIISLLSFGKSAFFESVVGVGTFVGGRSLEEYILPLTLQALTDAEEFVVEKRPHRNFSYRLFLLQFCLPDI